MTINNPLEKGWSREKIKEQLEQLKYRYYCISDEIGNETNTPHSHIFVVCNSPIRFERIKRLFPEAHIEKSLGTAAENRDYVAKSGKWSDDPKSDTTVQGSFEEVGELPEEKGRGYRSDLELIGGMIDDGMTPTEIMRSNFAFRKYSAMIRAAYFDKRRAETPTIRDVKVHYICGASGSGKSYTYVQLCEQYGEDNIYFVSEYQNGCFDLYNGEPILFLDEYKANFTHTQLLTLLDKYKSIVHARYSNVVALWNDVYISSIFAPEQLYKKMVDFDARAIDKQTQLFRRISDVTYCFKDIDGEYRRYTIDMKNYTTIEELKAEAEERLEIKTSSPEPDSTPKFEVIEDDDELPF